MKQYIRKQSHIKRSLMDDWKEIVEEQINKVSISILSSMAFHYSQNSGLLSRIAVRYSQISDTDIAKEVIGTVEIRHICKHCGYASKKPLCYRCNSSSTYISEWYDTQKCTSLIEAIKKHKQYHGKMIEFYIWRFNHNNKVNKDPLRISINYIFRGL